MGGRQYHPVSGVVSMTVNVVTTFSQKGYEVYGRKMIQSFADCWPQDVKLFAFYEGDKPDDASSRATWVSLDADKDRETFIRENEDRGDTPEDYRFRVIRYSHKVWAQTAAPRHGKLIWLDADTVTVNPVTSDILAQILPPDDKMAAYLARPYHRHTETGFISYNTNAGPLLDEMRRIYVSNEVFKLPEWHDCAVFDHARVKFERKGFRFHNLCPTAMGLNVFEQSPLASIIRHNKGPDRKHRAYGDAML